MDSRIVNNNQRPVFQRGQQPVPVNHMQPVPINQNRPPMMQGAPVNQQPPISQRGQQPVQHGLPVRQSLPVRQGTVSSEQPGGGHTSLPIRRVADVRGQIRDDDSRSSDRGLHDGRTGSEGASKKSKRGGINSGSHMTVADKALRLQYLLDYLQQVKIAKKSDIARALGIHPNKTISTLNTAVRHGYVERLTNTGLTQAVYANTAKGNELTTYAVDKLGIVKTVNMQLEHTLGVARIASCLTSPLDDVPELWEGMYDWKDAINERKAFLIGEPVMQNSWRTLVPAAKTISKDVSKFYQDYMAQVQSDDDMSTTDENEKFTAFKYVIPPQIVTDKGNGRYVYKFADNVYTDGRPMYNPTAGEKLLGYHVPDLVVASDYSSAFAIEFERSAKSPKEYDDIMLKLLSDYSRAVFENIIYLVPSRHVANTIERSLKKFPGAEDFIFVYMINSGRSPFFSMSNEIHAGL